jgi:hypothetical protein
MARRGRDLSPDLRQVAEDAGGFVSDEQPTADEDAAGFTDGFRRGWVAAIDAGRAGLAGLGFLLPFLVPLVVVTEAVRRLTLRLGLRPSRTARS